MQDESDAARSLLSAIPDGLLVVRDGGIWSVNRGLCEHARLRAPRASARHDRPFPFWPPEHRHEIEAWHAELAARGEAVAELTFRHSRGDRMRMLVSGRLVPGRASGGLRHLVTVRDVSASHRRERRLTELAARDTETGLLDRREFEERLGGAVRRAIQAGTNVTVVLAELAVHGRDGGGVFGRPEALLAVERLRGSSARATTSRGRATASSAGSFPRRTPPGGCEAVDRWRAELADVARRAADGGSSAISRARATRSRSTRSPIGRSRPPAGAARARPRPTLRRCGPTASDDPLRS